MALFTKCCCCFRLNTGGLVLGWVGIISSLAVLYKYMDDFKFSKHLSFEIDALPDTGNIRATYAIVFTFILLYLIASVCLLNGCRDLNHYLFLPWMILELISATHSMMMLVVFAFRIYNDYHSDVDDYKIAIILWIGILIFLRVYWWLCVQSYYEILSIQRKLRNAVEFPNIENDKQKLVCNNNKLGKIFIV